MLYKENSQSSFILLDTEIPLFFHCSILMLNLLYPELFFIYWVLYADVLMTISNTGLLMHTPVEVLCTLLKISHKMGITLTYLNWKSRISSVHGTNAYLLQKVIFDSHRTDGCSWELAMSFHSKEKFFWYSWSQSSAFKRGPKIFCTQGWKNWTFKVMFYIIATDGNKLRLL